MKEKVVGHIPTYLSKAMFKFLRLLHSKLRCTVTEVQALDMILLLNIPFVTRKDSILDSGKNKKRDGPYE